MRTSAITSATLTGFARRAALAALATLPLLAAPLAAQALPGASAPTAPATTAPPPAAPTAATCCAARAAVGARTPQGAADSLRVVRPMSTAERGVVGIAATLAGGTWGLAGAAGAGVTALAVCVARDGNVADQLQRCAAADEWLALGGALGTFAGAATGASAAARRLGCDARESRRRGWRGAALGTLAGAVPVAVYAAGGGRSTLVGAALVFVVPTLQIVGAARDAGRCRLPVPILHGSAAPGAPGTPAPSPAARNSAALLLP